MEQIFFILLVAAVGLIRLVMQVAEKKKNAESAKRTGAAPAKAPVQRAPAQTEEERIRKFMEALGVPVSSVPSAASPPPPPKVVRPRKDKIRPIDPFPKPRGSIWNPIPEIASEPPTVIAAPPPISSPVPETKIFTSTLPPNLPASFEVQSVGEKIPADATADRNWITRLTTPEGMRDAIVLREIFGPPRGLEPLITRSFN